MESQETKGEVGGTALFAPDAGIGELRKDAALVNRAIRERWQPSEDRRQAIRDKVEKRLLAEDITDPDDIAKLAGVVVRMEGQNQRDDLAYDPFVATAPPPSPLAALEGDEPQQVTYQQINFYVPDNGRGPTPPAPMNAPPSVNGNGHAHD